MQKLIEFAVFKYEKNWEMFIFDDKYKYYSAIRMIQFGFFVMKLEMNGSSCSPNVLSLFDCADCKDSVTRNTSGYA